MRKGAMRSWERGSPPPARKNRVVLSSMIVRVPENETVGDADGAKKEEKSFHPMKSLSPPLRQDRLQSLVDGSGLPLIYESLFTFLFGFQKPII